MATATALPAPRLREYFAVPLAGLAAREPLRFALYLRTGPRTWVLYRPAAEWLDEEQLGRLIAEGVAELYVRRADRDLYLTRVGDSLDDILSQDTVPLDRRVGVLHGVATQMADALLAAPPDRAGLQRARKVMTATGGLILRESQGLSAIRRAMSGSAGLTHHSLKVAFLSMGLARDALGADASGLATAGLAGLLHDVGRIGHEGEQDDAAHTRRGAEYLRGLGLPDPVVDAARWHHERWDGSGFPDALRGERIPETARVVGLVNTFDKVYSSQSPRVGVFDALRILAQAYRGCFESRFATGLVKLFR